VSAEDRISKERTVKKRVYLETTIVSYLAARPTDHLHASRADGSVAMREDPIVDEVRKRREENAKRFDFDVRAIAEDARKREQSSSHPLVTPEPREPAK